MLVLRMGKAGPDSPAREKTLPQNNFVLAKARTMLIGQAMS